MKIKKALALIFMMLFFIIGYGESEIPNTLITQNPEREVTTVKTNRRKEFGEFNIEINKVISKEIQGMVDPTQRTIFFDMGHLEKPITENDLIFVTEELEVFPSVAETNGQKRWSNVMEKYKKSYKDKTPVENNGLKYTFEAKTDEVDNSVSKTLKVFYMSPPETLYIGVVDKESYEVKAIYKFLASSAILKTNTVVGRANAVFTNEAFELMRADKVTNGYVKDFENIKIVKEKGKQATVESAGQKYFTLYPRDNTFLDTPDFTKIEKIKITNTKNGMSLEIQKAQMTTLPLSDGSIFKMKYTVTADKIEVIVIPVIFGNTPEADFKIEFLDNTNKSISTSILNTKFPNITHEGIGISSKDGTKNSLAPNNNYDIGIENDKIIENLTINNDQKTYLGGKIGLKAEGKNLQYIFYLLKVNDSLKLEFISENGDILNNTNGVYTFADKSNQNNKLEFTIDKDKSKVTMKVPSWDLSKINKSFYFEVKDTQQKSIYKVPLFISLPATKVSTGKMLFNYYSSYEDKFNSTTTETMDVINPEANLNYGEISVSEGEYPFSRNLIGAEKYYLNDSQEEKKFNMEYTNLALTNLSDVNIKYKYDIGNDKTGISVGFTKSDWEKLLSSRSTGSFKMTFKNYYGLTIGTYTIEIMANQKRESQVTIDNIERLFEKELVANQAVTTGKIFGVSDQSNIYSEKSNISGIEKEGKIFGISITGEELRYYDLQINDKIDLVGSNGTKKSYTISGDKEMEATTNVSIGFTSPSFIKRSINTEKSIYFILKNYDVSKGLDEEIGITISRNGKELFRDNLKIKVEPLNKVTDVKLNIMLLKSGNEYINKRLTISGKDVISTSGNIYGGVTLVDGNQGDFPIDITGIKYIDVRRHMLNLSQPQDGDKTDVPIEEFIKGYYVQQELTSVSYINKIKIFLDSNKNFSFVIDNTQNPYLNLKVELDLKDENKKIIKKYTITFYETRTNSNSNVSTLDLGNIGDINKYIKDYLLNENSNKKSLEIKTKRSYISNPNITLESDFYKNIIYSTKYAIQTIFPVGGAGYQTETEIDYSFYDKERLAGVGKATLYKDSSTPEISKIEKMVLEDGTEVSVGFVRAIDFYKEQKLFFQINKLGSHVYKGSYNYKTQIEQKGDTTMSGSISERAITDINFTIPKIEYQPIGISSSGENKNGLCPKFPFYFGTNNSTFNEGLDDSALSDHATKDSLNLNNGDIPYLIQRYNEIPTTDIDNFIMLEDTTAQKITSRNGRWIIDYANNQQIILEIIGKKGDGITKNKVKVRFSKWDDTPIKKNLKFLVYDDNRLNYFEVPINIDIKETKKTTGKLEIKLNEKYRNESNVYTKRFSFYDKTTEDKNDIFILRDSEKGEELGKLITETGTFDPERNTSNNNILLGGINLEVETNGKIISLKKGGIFDISGFSVYVGYDNNSNNKTGRLEMATEKWTNDIQKTFKLRVKNDYGVTVAEYDVTISGEGNQLKDEAFFNFGVVNSAMKHLETTVIKEIPLNEVVSDIKVEFSEKNPTLTLNGKAVASAPEDEKLYVTGFDVRYAEKDRIDPKKWNIKVSGFLAPLTSTDKKKEGKYTCPDPIFMSITVKDSGKGTREIKE